MRNKLKNNFYSNLANSINIASEERKIEEEFRLCKNYNMHKNSQTKLITNEKLTEFSEDHLKGKNVELQPEMINPSHYPHILPLKAIQYPLIFHLLKKYKMLLRVLKMGSVKGLTNSMERKLNIIFQQNLCFI